MIAELLEGNRRFVNSEFKPHLARYLTLAAAQHPKVLWIGCSDSRVSEHVITSTQPGTVFVHRNVANIVSFNDVNVAAVIEYGVTQLHIRDIVICGHYGCGGIRALEEGNVKENYISDWLLIASGAKDRADRIARERGLTGEAKLDLLTRENVKLQIEHLNKLSLIRNLRADSHAVRIHGLIYALKTGELEVLVDGRQAV
jgi:carbonic anhydrase